MPNNEFMYEFINNLAPYMLSSKNIAKYPEMMTQSKKHEAPIQKKNIMDSTDNIFYPTQKDQLFWCFFVTLHGLSEYEVISNYFTKEKEVKYNWIEEIRKKKDILKPLKISKQVVEDELANNPKISMNTIKALCNIFQINIFFIDNKKYYEMITNDTNPVYIIEKKINTYGLKQNVTKENLAYYRTYYWKLENLDKPLKAISNYKSDELASICNKLHIDCTTMTKPIMYQTILSML